MLRKQLENNKKKGMKVDPYMLKQLQEELREELRADLDEVSQDMSRPASTFENMLKQRLYESQRDDDMEEISLIFDELHSRYGP